MLLSLSNSWRSTSNGLHTPSDKTGTCSCRMGVLTSYIHYEIYIKILKRRLTLQFRRILLEFMSKTECCCQNIDKLLTCRLKLPSFLSAMLTIPETRRTNEILQEMRRFLCSQGKQWQWHVNISWQFTMTYWQTGRKFSVRWIGKGVNCSSPMLIERSTPDFA